MPKIIDLKGQILCGKLVLKESIKTTKSLSKHWVYKCLNCGSEGVTTTHQLKNGTWNKCKKCCLIKHKKPPEYRVWQSMKDRCFNENSQAYSLYGKRGIKIQKSWLDDYFNFVNDMGERPSKEHSLDRIDNNGNYTKENCRWTTRKEQCRNRNSNKEFEYKGDKKCIAEWAEMLNVKYDTFYEYLRKNDYNFEKTYNFYENKMSYNL